MDSNKPPPELDVDNLRATKVLGKGAMGTVFLVHANSHDDQPFALKVFEKSPDHHQSDRRAHHEINVLRRLSASPHPFLPHLIASSENPDFVCWAIPFCPGGDLNVLRQRQCDGVFSTAVIRFYLAEIISAVEYLHDQGIVYRDLKPENILVQQSGHVTLTDFDLSRDLAHRNLPNHNLDSISDQDEIKSVKRTRVSPVSRRYTKYDYPTEERLNSFVGTDEYIAPEIIRGDGHEFSVDWWALGVLCYEMMFGATPFKGSNRNDTYRNILFAEPAFPGKPNALTDLIRKLLDKEPTRRLGYRRGASEIKEHEFFRGLRWDLLTEISRPPFLPSDDETEMRGGGMFIWEYFEKLNSTLSSLWSPSPENSRYNDSFDEF
ncbi:hypothetical protein CASFOL_035329 [Castilleja foliolosa]|uniref:non-specific serine/threonine protein kinase n=1 Tax=Castilleja foliolosa TaxID=1961234 RepID=A0ABD3BUN3_9LAMI